MIACFYKIHFVPSLFENTIQIGHMYSYYFYVRNMKQKYHMHSFISLSIHKHFLWKF